MSNNKTLDIINKKANFLNNLSTNEEALFEYINTNKDNLDEVIQQYKPELDFRPVNTLRFLIANELKKGTVIDKTIIDKLKQALENRDVSFYFDLNESVKQSLLNYKESKVGMFPNWRHTFKILFPFIHNVSENNEIKILLDQLADDIISVNSLENVTKHVVSFQGSQNYGSDHAWVAIIPESSPSVQYAYQMFFIIDKNGLFGGIHKGHNLTKQTFDDQDLNFDVWEGYLEHTKQVKTDWEQLNSEVNFIFIKDEKDFIKAIKKVESNSLSDYFKTVDRLKDDLDIQDEEKLVFSLAKSRLSFQVGKRYCLNVNKNLFDFISNSDIEDDNTSRENFSGDGSAYLYKGRNIETVLNNYDDIKSAVENEIERDNHALAKFYDNSAFRKAVFDVEYRNGLLQNTKVIEKRNYWALGFNSNAERLQLFKKEGYWQALDYSKDDSRNSAKRARKLFSQIKTGDYIVIKGYGGSHDLIVHFKAEVISKSNENERLELKKINGSLYKGKAPRGSGAGNWHETILQVKREKDIKLLFEKNIIDMEIKFEEFLNLSLAEGTVKTYLSAIRSIEKLAKTEGILSDSIYDLINVKHFQDFWIKLKNIEAYIDTNEKHHNRYSSALLKYEEFLNSLTDNSNTKSTYKAPLNQIFYGPPGTGKTYNTILEAAKIINQNEALSYDEAQVIFNEQLRKRIEFITFHQNYSYEDFIQGLRPDIEQKALSFNRADGVFAKMVTNALFEYYKVYQKEQKQTVTTGNEKIDLNDAYIEFISTLKEEQEFETKTGKRIKIINFTDKENIEFKPVEGFKSYLVSGNRLLKLYKAFPNIEDIQRNIDIRGVIGGCNSTIYYVALREFISFIDSYKATVDDFEDLEGNKFDYEDITYRRKKELLSNISLEELRSVSENEVPKYVIIIDEINRANISRVFGELITLIEKDKRSHGKIPLSATLPSGEPFIIPSNLHIIGTMNTADKSIALLDIALRRRFEFVPMYPDSKSTDGKIVNNAIILDEINKAIIDRKGHDFTIGHSYFMGDDYDLKNTIDNKVIPLLLEYLMNDFEEVKKILKEATIDVQGWPMQYVSHGN